MSPTYQYLEGLLQSFKTEFIRLKFQCFISGNLKEISGFKSYKDSKRGEGKGIEIFVAREYGRFQDSFLCYTRN